MSDTLAGKKLEDYGKKIFSEMGFLCLNSLNNIPILELDPTGSYSKPEHLEIDYLIPEKDFCFIGEITARSTPTEVIKKYKKFKNHFNILKKSDWHEDFWVKLGVPKNDVGKFRDVKKLRAFFICTQLERFDVQIEETKDIINFFKTEWKLIESYSQTIGKYGKNHILDHLAIKPSVPNKSFQLLKTKHSLTVIKHKKVASGEIGIADIFTFEISPYEILEYSRVYRRDNLPLIESQDAQDYQRPLDINKLKSIREILIKNRDFIFPNNILCVLSDDSYYENDCLNIPCKYGALSIIDGQHRLFSFASEEIKKRIDDPKILVTAIQFRNVSSEQISKYSAKTFVEINMEQTKIDKTHLDFISYEILEDPNPRALAAQVILKANEREQGSLYGIFDTTQTGLGIIKTKEIISSLKSITNYNRIKRLKKAKSGGRLKLRIGYENLFRCKIEEVDNPDILISKATTLFVEYFDIVKKIFALDWPERGLDKNTSLKFAKVFVGFIRLLYQFLKEGLEWEEIEEELNSIKANVLKLRKMNAYEDILFLPEVDSIPDSKHYAADDYKFLHRNRKSPTSILVIVKEKYMAKIK